MSQLFTYDELWKGIIEVYFEDFMLFFYQGDCKEIDFSKGCEFLEQEFRKYFPPSETKNRRADKVIKFWKKSGVEDFIIVHIEVQGYEDASMSERVFNIYYRIFDMYHQPPATLVIYTDDNSKFHPKTFRLESLGTTMQLNYKTFKLSEHHPRTYPKGNCFSYVMETAWYDLRKNKLSDEELLEQKKSILDRMTADGFSSTDVYSFLRFIVHHTRFEKKEYFSKFEEHINFVIKNNKDMSIIEMEKIKMKEKGIDLTLEIAEFLRKGKKIEEIAFRFDITQTKVKEIKEKLGL